MATENKVYTLPDGELPTSWIDERDLLRKEWERRSPVAEKAFTQVWYRWFMLNFLIESGQTSSGELHEKMMAETNEKLIESYFGRHLSVIQAFERPELTTTTP